MLKKRVLRFGVQVLGFKVFLKGLRIGIYRAFRVSGFRGNLLKGSLKGSVKGSTGSNLRDLGFKGSGFTV